MPNYESFSSLTLINDKSTTVVLDLGHAYTKVGFAAEISPRAIIRSEVRCRHTRKLVPVFDYTNHDELRHHMIDFLHKIYFKCILVNPKDRRVVIVENVLGPLIVKETIASVLFKYYEVSSALFVPLHLVCLLTLALPTALVIEIGYKEASVIPVYENVPVLCSWQALPLGSEAIHKSLSTLLLDRALCTDEEGKEQRLNAVLDSIPEKILEDIKVRCCFVSTVERKDRLHSNLYDRSVEPPPPPPNVDYPFMGDLIIKIPGTVRELSTEILFETDADDLSITTQILNAIVSCPIDMRKSLAENIVIIGGTASLTGLKHRIMSELRLLSELNSYSKYFKLVTFKIHDPPAKDNYVAWLGASIMGCTESTPMRSVTRETYLNNGFLPDWSEQLSFLPKQGENGCFQVSSFS